MSPLLFSAVRQQAAAAPSSGSSSAKGKAPVVTASAAPVNEEGLYKSTLSVEERVNLAMSVGEEVLTPEELTALFTAKDHPIVYDGFEPSGRMVAFLLLVPSLS